MISRIINQFSAKLGAKPFIWGFLSIIVFLLTFNLLTLRDFFPPYFSFLQLFLWCGLFFFRTIGFYLSMASLIPFFYWAFQEKAVWELTLLYSLSISYFTSLIALEEDHAFFACQEEKKESEKFEEEKRAFFETIEQMKEEAQRRYLERSNLQEEQVMLKTEQLKQNQEIKKLEGDLAQSHEKILDLTKLKKECDLELMRYKTEQSEQNQKIIKLEDNLAQSHEKVQNLIKLKHEWEEREQIANEQSEALRKELNFLKDKIEEEKRRCHSLESQIIGNHSLTEKNHDLAHMTGKYHQLRQQFEEKANVLSQTRRELFQTQTKLQILEREMLMAGSDVHIDETVFTVACEKESEENEQLREEVKSLEELTTLFIKKQT